MSKLIPLALVFVLSGVSAFAQATAPSQAVMARLDALEAREAIRALWAEYGRTLDARDFVAFSKLFARNAEFGSGPGAAKGPAAIGAFLEKAIGTNYPDSKGKNFHWPSSLTSSSRYSASSRKSALELSGVAIT